METGLIQSKSDCVHTDAFSFRNVWNEMCLGRNCVLYPAKSCKGIIKDLWIAGIS